jgi:peptide/nickel transport system substrate-binding protein
MQPQKAPCGGARARSSFADGVAVHAAAEDSMTPFAGRIAAAVLALLPPGLASAQALRVGLQAEITSIDPHFHNFQANKALAAHVFEPLIRQDAQQQLGPGLALSWAAVDERTWEFRLRPGVRFHDGTPLTADDVAFTLGRAGNVPGSLSSFAIYISQVSGVEVVDAQTVRMRTNAVFPLMPVYMSTFGIVSRRHGQAATTEDYNTGRAAIGTGPYRVVSWSRGERVELARHETHWEGRPDWSAVTFRFIPNDAARVAALLAGDVEVVDQLPPADTARLRRDARVGIAETTSNRLIFITMDHLDRPAPFVTDRQGRPLDRNPFRDLRVRQAFAAAVNRPAIVERVMEGMAEPAGQLMPRDFFGHAPDLVPPQADPERARQLLREAGYPDGFVLTLHCPNDRYVNDRQICQAIGQMLARIGIETRVEALPFSGYATRASRQEFSAFLFGWGIDTAEPTSPLGGVLATFDRATGRGAANRSRYSNPRVDELLTQGLATLQDAQREAILAEATRVAMRDVALVPLHHSRVAWAARRGIAFTPRSDEWTLAMSARPEPR